jgi:hypothetical protein
MSEMKKIGVKGGKRSNKKYIINRVSTAQPSNYLIMSTLQTYLQHSYNIL